MKSEYIETAYLEAKKAYEQNEVPVGVVIVKDGEIISKAFNQKVSSNSVFAHAEIIAINEASTKLNDWRLNDCEMYVTLEPCPMCAGAIVQSRMKKVYIGTKSNFASNHEIIDMIFDNQEFYHRVEYEYINDVSCEKILKDFFKKVRNK